MNSDVRHWARSCLQCQRTKATKHTRTALLPFRPPDNRFVHVHIDIVGPLPLSQGLTYIFTCVDRYIRWPEAFPLVDITAHVVAQALVAVWVSRYGCPSVLTMDRGRQFQCTMFTSLTQLLGTRHIHTRAYHRSANGMVERLHRQLKAALIAHDNRDRWTHHLPLVPLGIRTAIKYDLDCTEMEMGFGTRLRLPGESIYSSDATPQPPASQSADHLRLLFQHIRPTLPHLSHKQTIFVSQDLSTCSHDFVRNDAIKNSLTPAYHGPYKVLARTDKNMTPSMNRKPDVVAMGRIKPAYSDVPATSCTPTASSTSSHSQQATTQRHLTWTPAAGAT